MSTRYNGLEHNLAALQDFIKRDSGSYKDEFLEQYRHYENTLKLFQLQPDLDSGHLIDVVNFLSQVAHCYPNVTSKLPLDIIEILSQSGSALDPNLRSSLCKCLVILRNKGLCDPIAVLRVFFDLSKCRDKALRKYIFESTVSYAKYLLLKKKCPKLISSIQAFVFSKLSESHAVVCRLALLICIDLYRRRVWQDAKTANTISRACFHKVAKVFVTACKFFLGKDMFDEKAESSDDEEEENDGKEKKSLKELMVGYKAAKKTRKRKKQLQRAKENLKKVETKHKTKHNKLKQLDFSAFHYLYDAQDFVEKLFKKLEKSTDRFEVKQMLMALIARTIGIHKLQLLSFYPYLQRYCRPSQRDVTKILLFAAQSTHDVVPPDVVQDMLKTIVNNFVSDHCSAEAITVGLNTVREIADKCPLAIDQDLLDDLVAYKTYKNKNVSMAAKGLIQTFRQINPGMLKKRDRGQPTEFSKSIEPAKHFGELRPAQGFVPGAECLVDRKAASRQSAAENVEAADGGDDDSTVDEQESDDDQSVLSDIEEVDEEDQGSGSDSWASVRADGLEEDEQENQTSSEQQHQPSADDKVPEKRVAFAKTVSETHIFSATDFKRINAYQMKQKILPAKGRKRAAEEELQYESDGASDNESDDDQSRPEITRLRDIEHLHKKPKQDKAARCETAQAGREGREKFGRPKKKGSHVGRTNKNVAKRKPFTMVRQKQRGKLKKRSFRDKQRVLRKYLTNQKKMK